MKKICLVSNLHLCSNPRLWKEANSLAAAGYEVVILTIWTSAEKREQDKSFIRHPNIRYKAAINLVPQEVSSVQRFYMRARRRLSIEVKKRLRIDTLWILDFAPSTMLKAALREKADLYICHTEYGMQVGRELILRKQKVAFDIEDWYSKDYLVPSRPVKLLEQLEKFSLENGLYCTCPSKSMAAAIQQYHKTRNTIEVVYNGFSIVENGGIAPFQTGARKLSSMIWFSQTIGAGRGLETLMQALEKTSTVMELHLLGNCSKEYKEWLIKNFPSGQGHQLFFHAPVPHAELLNTLHQYDIGLALEQDFPESRNTTITNKILQYLQAGIKVLATATRGQQEVANDFPESVQVIPIKNEAGWAAGIDRLVAATPVSKSVLMEKFSRLYSWESQERKLLELVDRAIENKAMPANSIAH